MKLTRFHGLIPNMPEHRLLLPLMQRFAEVPVSYALLGGFLSGEE
jgi:hypothetical protein